MTKVDILNEIEVLKTELDFLKSSGELSKRDEQEMWEEIKKLEKELDKWGKM